MAMNRMYFARDVKIESVLFLAGESMRDGLVAMMVRIGSTGAVCV